LHREHTTHVRLRGGRHFDGGARAPEAGELNTRSPTSTTKTQEKQMNTRTKIGSLMGGAVITAATIGMSAGLAPATAAPSQSPGSTLTIVDQNITGPGKNRVIVYGVYPMQKPDAVGYLNNLTAGCGGMHYIVWGDDGGEQYLFDRNYPGVHDDIDGFVKATDRGLEYLQQFEVPAPVLDEDKDGADEVFVRARFVDGDCGSRVQNTNVVKGSF
jgi:hypothetical protein